MAAGTLATFAGVRDNGFIWLDDPYYLTENPWISNGLTLRSAVYAITARDVWNWHPVTWWSHLLDVSLFGLAPGPHHLMSAALHALTAAVLCALGWRATGRPGPAVFVAFAFAVHPQRVESVAWASERKDVLCGLFFLLAALAHLERPFTARARALRLVYALLALGSKPMAVTLPCALLLLDVWPLGVLARARDLPRRALALAELWALAAVGVALTLWAQARRIPEQSSWSERLGDSAYAVLAYVSELAVPLALSPSHPRESERPGALLAVVAVILVACLTGGALTLLQRVPVVGVGWLWFVGILVPTLGVVRVGGALYADRYTYLPSIGICAILAAAGVALARRAPRAVPVLAAALLITWAALTVRLVPAWRSSESLAFHALEVGPRDVGIRMTLAYQSFGQGKREAALAFAEDAERVHQAADTADLVGQALLHVGREEEARAAFLRALARDPDHVPALVHLGELELGRDLAAAEGYLARALARERSARTLRAQARARAAGGDEEEAERLRAEAAALPVDDLMFGPRGAFPSHARR